MAEKYWFKTHVRGFGWKPNTWEGWFVIIIYFAALIYSFFEVDRISHSASDTLFNFLPRLFIFSALLISVTYLKGEPLKKS